MNLTAFDIAQRYISIKELPGGLDHPLIRWWLSLCGFDAATVHDEVPWCSAFVQGPTWELRLPRSKSAAARSWLQFGVPIEITEAKAAYDVVVLKRGAGAQPGPEVLSAPGHVGFFAGLDGLHVRELGGNHGDAVTIANFPRGLVLGVRRLYAGD